MEAGRPAGHRGRRGGCVVTDLLVDAEVLRAQVRDKARAPAISLDRANVEFREGLAEALPVDDGWADVVISNGVINLCADKRAVFAEVFRVLRPGGILQFADIANGRPVPPDAL